MATNNKPAAELRIGTVKATVWENEVGQWKTSQSFAFVNLLSVAKLADQAHTLIAERKAQAAKAGDDNTEAA